MQDWNSSTWVSVDEPKDSEAAGAVVLIVGAGSGVGRAVARAFAQDGARHMVLADLAPDTASRTAGEICRDFGLRDGEDVLARRVDVVDRVSVQAMVEATVEQFGRIDKLVNTAGVVASPMTLTDTTAKEFDQVYRVNVTGALNLLQEVGPVMERVQASTRLSGPAASSSRSMVFLASAFCFAASRNHGAYVSSKHALLGLLRTAALEMAHRHVRVNAVCPTWVDTPLMAEGLRTNPGLKAYIKRVVPLGRMATAEEVAQVVLFLSSDGASFVTGAAWSVDGGLSAGLPPLPGLDLPGGSGSGSGSLEALGHPERLGRAGKSGPTRESEFPQISTL